MKPRCGATVMGRTGFGGDRLRRKGTIVGADQRSGDWFGFYAIFLLTNQLAFNISFTLSKLSLISHITIQLDDLMFEY